MMMNFSMRNYVVFFYLMLKSTLALSMCKKNITSIERISTLSLCIAECLNLIVSTPTGPAGQSKKDCKFNTKTGTGLGDNCSKYTYPNSKAYKIACDYDHAQMLSLWPNYDACRHCDFMSINPVFKYITPTGVFEEYPNFYNEFEPIQRRLKVLGIDLLLEVGSHNEDQVIGPQALSTVSTNKTMRESFVAYVTKIVEKYRFEGLFVKWIFPGCPRGACAPSKDKMGVTSLMQDFSAAMKPRKKTIAYLALGVDYNILWSAENYFLDIATYVDIFVFIMHGQAGGWSTGVELPYSLAKAKPYLKGILAKSKIDPKKVMVSFNPAFAIFELSDSKQTKIGSKQNGKNFRYTPFPTACNMIRTGEKILSPETQNYASNNNSWIAYDSYVSIKRKITEMVMEIELMGIHIEGLYSDDTDGFCGCGRFPFLQMAAAALIGEDCVYKICI